MNKVLSISTFVALMLAFLFLIGTTVAQDARGTSNLLGANDLSETPDAPPKYCRPCLFYGGDWNPGDLNSISWGNADDPVDGGLETSYVPFVVPEGETWRVTALFTNNETAGSFLGSPGPTGIDPQRGIWSITTGISEGTAGTTVAKGSAPATFEPTGRFFNTGFSELLEYTLLIRLPRPVVLTAGTYWLGAVPECLVLADTNCQIGSYFLNDSIAQAHHFGPAQPPRQIFGNAPRIQPPINYANACDGLAKLPKSCWYASAGVIGTKR